MPENNEGTQTAAALLLSDESIRYFREIYQQHMEVMIYNLGIYDFRRGFRPKNELKYETVETSLP